MLFQISARKSTPKSTAIHAHDRAFALAMEVMVRSPHQVSHSWENFPLKLFFGKPIDLPAIGVSDFHGIFTKKNLNFFLNTLHFEPFESDNGFGANDFKINTVSLQLHGIYLSSFMGPTTFRSSWKIVFFVNANGSSENYYWWWSGNSELWREWIDAPLWRRDGGTYNEEQDEVMWSEQKCDRESTNGVESVSTERWAVQRAEHANQSGEHFHSVRGDAKWTEYPYENDGRKTEGKKKIIHTQERERGGENREKRKENLSRIIHIT